MQPNSPPPAGLGQAHRVVFAKAGTVALPPCPPATGDLYLIRNPHLDPVLAGLGVGIPEFVVKLVQMVNDLNEVTRYVALRDVKAVTRAESAGDGPTPTRRSFPIDDLLKEVGQDVGLLAPAKGSAAQEPQLLLRNVVIHVTETAPVLVRLVSHFGVTAAEAAENVALGLGKDGCCFRDGKSW